MTLNPEVGSCCRPIATLWLPRRGGGVAGHRRGCHPSRGSWGATSRHKGSRVFNSEGGGGGGRKSPQNWGGGGAFGKRAQLRGPLISYYELGPKAPKIFLSIENGPFSPPNTWQMMTFLNPLNALIPEIPFSLLPNFGSGSPPGPPWSVSVGFCGARQLSPLFWGVGQARGLY